MFLRNSLIIFFIFILSCQPVEIIKPVDIDNIRLEKFSINAKEIVINVKYNPIFSEENIEDQLLNTPLDKISKWNKENIGNFGKENKFYINIIDASILKKEIENIDAKKYEEKTVFKYEVFYLVEYQLYNDNDYLLANTTVETSRSTTSQKYISLSETDLITANLVNEALIDFTIETKSMLEIYMSEYLQ